MAYRKSGIDAFSQPRPPSASRPFASPGNHRVRRPASPASYTRRPLPPGPGPLDKKGEKLILKPINGACESFKPRKPSERSSNIKPLRALHSLDQQYTGRPESETSTFGQASSSILNTRRTKSFDDINCIDQKKKFGDSPNKLQPLNYRSSNFGHLSENLARGGSPHHNSRISPSSHIKVETSYLASYSSPSTSPRVSPHSPSSPKPRRESFGGTSTLRRTSTLLANKRSTSLGESSGSFSRSRPSLVSVHCYQNTIYQCLSHTVKFREFMVLNSHNDINPNSLAGGDMIKEFAKLVREMWDNSKKKRVLKPTALRRVVSRNLTFFANYRQHDAQEFLCICGCFA
ncbi:uncharacterized protein [Amphiura filiformis]|uniref:uncharacterized protein isoform X2 n=1 Tax=Amphiura filiformis TaxID=82378 RepID=UPI003B21BB67